MKKLRLSLDALAVESFEPLAAVAAYAGTVRAREDGTDASNCATCDNLRGPQLHRVRLQQHYGRLTRRSGGDGRRAGASRERRRPVSPS